VLILHDESDIVSAYLDHQQLTLHEFTKQPKQAQIVSSKSLDRHSYTPPVDYPWRTYGKKINGLPVLLPDH